MNVVCQTVTVPLVVACVCNHTDPTHVSKRQLTEVKPSIHTNIVIECRMGLLKFLQLLLALPKCSHSNYFTVWLTLSFRQCAQERLAETKQVQRGKNNHGRKQVSPCNLKKGLPLFSGSFPTNDLAVWWTFLLHDSRTIMFCIVSW